MTSINGGWESPFTFPSDATRVRAKVTLDELEPKSKSPLNNKIIKTTSGIMTIFEVESINHRISEKDHILYQNYPNPFNPSTNIEFKIQNSGHVNLIVYDVLGRQVDKLYDGYLSKGVHSMKWNAEMFPSGQ